MYNGIFIKANSLDEISNHWYALAINNGIINALKPEQLTTNTASVINQQKYDVESEQKEKTN